MRRLAVGALIALALTPLAAAPVVAQVVVEQSETARQSFSEIAGCLGARDELRVLLVVDESRSLQETDPDAQRTDGLLAALDSLAVLQQALPDKKINVASATFAQDYRKAIGWGGAEGRHLDQLRSWAADDVPQLDGGTATDYRAAMLGARADLATESPTCNVMLWFTDGGLDVADSETATAAALDEICTEGGIADLLRGDRVFVLAAALFRSDSTLVTNEDRAHLAQIAEGEAQGGSCGSVPIPERYAAGAYLSANDPSQLSALFATLLAQISGYTPVNNVLCPGDECVSGVLRFPVDPGISFLRIIASPTEGSPTYALTTPEGANASLPTDGEVDLGPFKAHSTTAGTTQQIDVGLQGAPAEGQWQLSVQKGAAHIGIFQQAGIQVALADPAQELAGESETPVDLNITDIASGRPVDPAVFGSMLVSGTVDDGTSVAARQDDGVWRMEVPAPPSGTLPPSRLLTVSVDLVTKPSGSVLEPIVRQFDLPVSVSAAYPSLVDPTLQMSPVEGEGTSMGSIRIAGSSLGPTRACTGSFTAQGPSNQGDISVAPTAECVDVPQGGQASLDFSSTLTAAADGSATGEAQVTVSGYRQDDPTLTFAVPAEMNLSRPIDEAVRWVWVLALLAASLVLPLLLIYVLGRRLARLQAGPATWIREVRVPVIVKNAGAEALLSGDNGPFRLPRDGQSARIQAPAKDAAEWSTPGLTFKTAFRFLGRRRIGPIAKFPTLALEPSATATLAASGQLAVLTSSKPPHTRAESIDKAPANLRIERDWYLAFPVSELTSALRSEEDPESYRVPAELILLIPDTAFETDAEKEFDLARQDQLPRDMLDRALDHARRIPQAPEQRPPKPGDEDVLWPDSSPGAIPDDFAWGSSAPSPSREPDGRPVPQQTPPTSPSRPPIDDSDPDW